MRVWLIAAVIVAVQWVVIHRFPEPRWVLLALAVPALLWAASLTGLAAVISGLLGGRGARRGGGRR